MDGLLRDLRYGLRQLAASPVTTAAAVLSLALGIGVNTAIFSFVDALFLAPLPVAEPDRLVAIYTTDPANPGLLPLSHPNFADLAREPPPALAGVAGVRGVRVALAVGGGEPAPVPADLVSGGYFELLGVEAAHGRTFGRETDDAPGAHPVAVLSDHLWRRGFGADRAAVGRTVRINRRPYTVVGVAPAGFRGVNLLSAPELWLPLGQRGELATGALGGFFDQRRALMMGVVGRLAEGVPSRAAESALAAAARELERAYPQDNRRRGLAAVPIARAAIHPGQRDAFVLAGRALAAVAGLVLLVACANVANLLLARSAARRKDFAVRLAVGSGRRRLARQLVVEGLLLAAAGGALGVLVGVATRELLWTFRPPMLPEGLDVGLDGRVLAFTAAVSVLTGLLFAALPAVRSARTDLVTHLKIDPGTSVGGRRRFGLADALVAAQIGFSLVALVGTALFLRSLDAVYAMDLGFEKERLVSVGFDLGAQGYGRPRAEALQRRALAAADALPGVESAALAERGLLDATGVQRRVAIDGRADPEGDAVLVRVNAVGPGYFETVGVPRVAGRLFAEADREGAPRVAVVNRTMAERFWPGDDPVGRRFAFVGSEGSIEVAGVVADAKYVSPAEDPMPYIYLPLAQGWVPATTLLVRTAGPAEPVVAPLRSALRRLDPELPLDGPTAVGDFLRAFPSGLRMASVFLGTFAALAVVLACLGIFGVTEHSVSRRRRELAIRMAMGARRRDVLAGVVRRGMGVVGVGLLLGIAAAALFARWIARFLVAASPADPLAFVLAAVLFVAVAAAALVVPARRAAATEPAGLLRNR